MVTSKMTRMNVYSGVHLKVKVIIMHECNDYNWGMNVYERMH